MTNDGDGRREGDGGYDGMMRSFEVELYRRIPRYEGLLGNNQAAQAFVQNALSYVMGNPEILTWNARHTMRALMEIARIGLAPHGVIPGVHLIPFNTKGDDGWETRAVPVTDYKAEVGLAIEAGAVSHVQVEMVRDRDDFDWYYKRGELKQHHRWDIRTSAADRGAIVGAWCIAQNPLDRRHPYAEFMNLADLREFGMRYASKKGKLKGLWASDEDDFDLATVFRKTVIRQALRLAPRAVKGTRYAHAVAMDERSMRGLAPPDEDASKSQAAAQRGKIIDVPTEPEPERPTGQGIRDAAAKAAGDDHGQGPARDDDEPAPEAPPEYADEPTSQMEPEPEPQKREKPAARPPTAIKAAAPAEPAGPPTFEEARKHVLSWGRYGVNGEEKRPIDAIEGDEGLEYLQWVATGPRQSTPRDVECARVYLESDLIAPLLDGDDSTE